MVGLQASCFQIPGICEYHLAILVPLKIPRDLNSTPYPGIHFVFVITLKNTANEILQFLVDDLFICNKEFLLRVIVKPSLE